MNQYMYEGPVYEFERLIVDNWKASTYAPSEKKARNNLTYRFKKLHNRVANTRINLPGKIKLIQQTKGEI